MKFTLFISQDQPEEIVATVRRPTPLTDEIERLVREDQGDTALTVYDEHQEMMLPLAYTDIECVSVNNNHTTVIAADGKAYTSRLRLYELEEKLPACFIRINKSALANRSRIARFEAAITGAVNVVFKSGYSDYVSRRCFADIKRRMDEK